MEASLSPVLAIIAGNGQLPKLLVNDCVENKRPYHIVRVGSDDQEWMKNHPVIAARFEKVGSLFKKLRKFNCRQVVFAGSIKRPNLNPLYYDHKFIYLLPRLLRSLSAGDDTILRTVIAIFEEEGFKVIGVHEILKSIVALPNLYTKNQPSKNDLTDAKRAEDIVNKLSCVDVGQAAVVAQGICLGIETIQGTDSLLKFVGDTRKNFHFNNKGILFKGPKINQEFRVDLPTIGLTTIHNVYRAGLGGIVLKANKVLLINKKKMIETADRLGLFIHVVP